MREYSNQLAAAVTAYLDSQEWRYNFDQENGVFRFGINVDSRIKSVNMYIRISERGFVAYGLPEMKADDASARQLAEYFTYCNFGLPYGNFELDFSDGEINFKSSLLCGDTIPPMGVVESIVDMPIRMWERYGNGMLAVLFGGASPKEEAAKADA
jgi:hypothetical protein